ncbi:MAG: hypothetical protein ACREYE_00635 [Gammaproteobacteria bacterium]
MTLGLGRRFNLSALTSLLLFFSTLLTQNALAALITAEPTQGSAGTQVTVNGSEWRAGDLVELSWNFPPFDPAASVQADGNGAFTAAVTVPHDAPIGPTQVNAINQTGDLTWQAPFDVLGSDLTGCIDAYFIGVHGTAEGPDSQNQNQTLSEVIGETWANFYNLAVVA